MASTARGLLHCIRALVAAARGDEHEPAGSDRRGRGPVVQGYTVRQRARQVRGQRAHLQPARVDQPDEAHHPDRAGHRRTQRALEGTQRDRRCESHCFFHLQNTFGLACDICVVCFATLAESLTFIGCAVETGRPCSHVRVVVVENLSSGCSACEHKLISRLGTWPSNLCADWLDVLVGFSEWKEAVFCSCRVSAKEWRTKRLPRLILQSLLSVTPTSITTDTRPVKYVLTLRCFQEEETLAQNGSCFCLSYKQRQKTPDGRQKCNLKWMGYCSVSVLFALWSAVM